MFSSRSASVSAKIETTMVWQLRDPAFREAIRGVIDRMHGRCALAGTTGVQIHLAAAVGIEKLGPPAHAIEVVALEQARVPELIGTVPVKRVDALGFEASVVARRSEVVLGEERFPVAAPEHILGFILAASELLADAQWAAFVLMRTCDDLDLEEVRGILKRGASVDRQALLAELAYLAA
jgi:hypothetical protein